MIGWSVGTPGNWRGGRGERLGGDVGWDVGEEDGEDVVEVGEEGGEDHLGNVGHLRDGEKAKGLEEGFIKRWRRGG